MKYDDIPAPMRHALATYEMLRRLGFPSDDIHWHHNGNEPPGGPEPRNMMFVVLQTQNKTFTLRTGIFNKSYEEWKVEWVRVMNASLDDTISEEDFARLLSESEAYQMTDDLCAAIRAKGIRIPTFDACLS